MNRKGEGPGSPGASPLDPSAPNIKTGESPVNARRMLLLAVLVGLPAASSDGAPPPKLALKGGRIIPVCGAEIAKGTLLIEQGKITAVGKDVKIPYDAMVVDCSGKVLFPGMIEPQSPYIEHPELIAQRIGRYAELLGRERVMAGVDCGFSVHAGSNSLDPEIVWAKLAALAEGSAIASARYW